MGRRKRVVGLAMVTAVVAFPACVQRTAPGLVVPPGGLSGDVRLMGSPGAGTTLRPMVVSVQAVTPLGALDRVPERVPIASHTDRFDPAFAAVATGDSIVFVNGGGLSHRLFSADITGDVRVPLSPFSSSTPLPIHRTGEIRFFCSLHPDESFGILVTDHVAFDMIDDNGWYDLWPLPDGAYRLSIWSPTVRGPVRVVQVTSGRLSIEPIRLDPDLINE